MSKREAMGLPFVRWWWFSTQLGGPEGLDVPPSATLRDRSHRVPVSPSVRQVWTSPGQRMCD